MSRIIGRSLQSERSVKSRPTRHPPCLRSSTARDGRDALGADPSHEPEDRHSSSQRVPAFKIAAAITRELPSSLELRA